METSCSAGPSFPCQPPDCRRQSVLRAHMKSRSSCSQPARGDFTLWETRKYFLDDSVEDGSLSNTPKTWSEKHAEVASMAVMNPGSTARLSSSWLRRCSDQAAGASKQERIRAFQLTLFHPNFSQQKDRLRTAGKCAWIQCRQTFKGAVLWWVLGSLLGGQNLLWKSTCLEATPYWAVCLFAEVA